MTKMNKVEAIEYIEMVDYDHETAVDMVKDLPDEFDHDDVEMSSYVHDVITYGVMEMDRVMEILEE